MSSSPFDALGDASTLGGVVVGAVVATAGSFAASWYERQQFRREREADAALVLGDLLQTLAAHIAVLRAAHARGDPFGPITIRMARAVRREVEIYDRNRERLIMVQDPALRPKTSALMARLTFALDRMLDATEALSGRCSEAEQAALRTARDQAFEFLVECATELPALVARFAALSNGPLGDFDLEGIGLGPPTGQSSNAATQDAPPP